MANMEGTWLSIFEYSKLKKSSISTIRRRIKAQNLKFRLNNGKYEIFTLVDKTQKLTDHNDQVIALMKENEELRKKTKQLSERCDELEMLVNLYEKSHHSPTNEAPLYS